VMTVWRALKLLIYYRRFNSIGMKERFNMIMSHNQNHLRIVFPIWFKCLKFVTSFGTEIKLCNFKWKPPTNETKQDANFFGCNFETVTSSWWILWQHFGVRGPRNGLTTLLTSWVRKYDGKCLSRKAFYRKTKNLAAKYGEKYSKWYLIFFITVKWWKQVGVVQPNPNAW
jgi:hypothetical protein